MQKKKEPDYYFDTKRKKLYSVCLFCHQAAKKKRYFERRTHVL